MSTTEEPVPQEHGEDNALAPTETDAPQGPSLLVRNVTDIS